MGKKLGIFLLLTFFLVFSSLYEHYSTESQLHYTHHLEKGKLYMNKNLASRIGEISKNISATLGFDMKVHFSDDSGSVESMIIVKKYANIISTRNSNFLTLLKSLGEIKSNGDSFYKIKDQTQKTCKNQYIDNIQVSQIGMRLKGYFLDCSQSFYSFFIQLRPSNDIKIHAVSQGSIYNRIVIYFPHDSNNNYFGLGQQFSNLNLGNNRPYSIFVREKGVARTDQPETFVLNILFGKAGSYYNSYSPAPIWISSAFLSSQGTPIHTAYASQQWAYSVWMNNQILVWSKTVVINIYSSKSIKQILKKISIYNGYTPVIPDWVNEGAIVGLQGGTSSVIQKYNKLEKKGAKIGGLWLQDWVNKRKSFGFSRLWWNWELDHTHYKGWQKMKNELKEKNVNLLIYINPMLTQVENKKANYTNNFYKQAKEKNHFVKLRQQKLFQTSAFSDWKASLLNITEQPSQSNQYFKNIFKLAIKQTGAKGLMVDFGEAYPVENIYNSLEQATQFHNKYPVSYLKLVYQTLQQINDPQIYTFTRAGYLYAPKYAMSLWAGDQSMNFKPNSGLPSCLTAMLSSGLVGYSNTHCDIGGYSSYKLPLINTSVRTRILMSRWMQLASFSPVFRTHEGNLPEQSLQVYSDQQIGEQFAFYSNIYSLLSQYRKAQSKESEEDKIPLIRPLFIENQNIVETYKIEDQFYLGSDILVSPILRQQNNRRNFIPIGQWVNIWSKEAVEGCNCFQDSTSFLPHVLIKAESPYKERIIEEVEKLLIRFKNIKYLNDLNQQIKQL